MLVLKAAAAALVCAPLFAAGLVATTGLVVVDVKPSEGPRIVVPVPLLLARAALGFAPDEAVRVEVPELREYSEIAARLVAELRKCDDGVLVEVDEGDDRVRIEKDGDELRIEASSGREEVSVRIPLGAAAEVLESYDGERLQVAAILDALSSSGSLGGTDLVHVRSDDEEVRVWVW
jgi:hypothetical protein